MSMQHTPYNLTVLCSTVLVFAILFEIIALVVFLKGKTLSTYQDEIVKHHFAIGLIPASVLAVVLIYHANVLTEKTKEDAKLGLAKFSIAVGSILLIINTFIYMSIAFVAVDFKNVKIVENMKTWANQRFNNKKDLK